MSGKAERWLVEQEIARLEAMYQLESPPEEPEDWREVIRLEAQKVRPSRSHPPTNPSQANGAITG
jgi:hypothetical protein